MFITYFSSQQEAILHQLWLHNFTFDPKELHLAANPTYQNFPASINGDFGPSTLPKEIWVSLFTFEIFTFFILYPSSPSLLWWCLHCVLTLISWTKTFLLRTSIEIKPQTYSKCECQMLPYFITSIWR